MPVSVFPFYSSRCHLRRCSPRCPGVWCPPTHHHSFTTRLHFFLLMPRMHTLLLFTSLSMIVQWYAHFSHVSVCSTAPSFKGRNKLWYLLPLVFGRTCTPTQTQMTPAIFGGPPPPLRSSLSFLLFFASLSSPR